MRCVHGHRDEDGELRASAVGGPSPTLIASLTLAVDAFLKKRT